MPGQVKEMMVGYKDENSIEPVKKLIEKHGGTIKDQFKISKTFLVDMPADSFNVLEASDHISTVELVQEARIN